MINEQRFTIGILTTTAVVLFAALAIVWTQPQAQAGTMTTSNGPYVLTVGELTLNDEEVVFVLNAPEQKLIAYRFDAAKREITVVDGIDLAAIRNAGGTGGRP